MPFGEAIRTCYRKSFSVRARARRSEYWWFWLFAIGVVVAAMTLMVQIAPEDEAFLNTSSPDPGRVAFLVLEGAVFLAVVIPLISVTLRRMYDLEGSRAYRLRLVPLLEWVLLFLEGTPGPNLYGPDPRG